MNQMNQGLDRWIHREGRGLMDDRITPEELRAMQGEPIPPDVRTVTTSGISATEAAFRAEAPAPDDLHNALWLPHLAGTCAHCDQVKEDEPHD